MYAFLLALSLNIDSLSIGVNYGLRKIKISQFISVWRFRLMH
jgi:putative Mn2+ efflux pump MntP